MKKLNKKELPYDAYDIGNIVSITKNDKCVGVNNDEIIVNCKKIQEKDCCANILDLILNKGASVVGLDYMDFINKSGTAEYNFDLVEDIAIDNFSEDIRKMELSVNAKNIIYIVGNISLSDATNVMEEIISIWEQEILLGLIYDGEYPENMFDMYIWKERLYK